MGNCTTETLADGKTESIADVVGVYVVGDTDVAGDDRCKNE